MNYSVIRYPVKKDAVAENRALVEGVFGELAEKRPAALRYFVLELPDGEFIHIVGKDEAAAQSPLAELAAFTAFTENHESRRAAPVARSAARVIGEYSAEATSRNV